MPPDSAKCLKGFIRPDLILRHRRTRRGSYSKNVNDKCRPISFISFRCLRHFASKGNQSHRLFPCYRALTLYCRIKCTHTRYSCANKACSCFAFPPNVTIFLSVYSHSYGQVFFFFQTINSQKLHLFKNVVFLFLRFHELAFLKRFNFFYNV